MKPTRDHVDPPGPDRPAPAVLNTPCGCSGTCGAHTGTCPARQFHRYPGTRTIVHLVATEHGPRCPFCVLAATRPNSTSDRTAAALRRPSADGDQGDLFDTAPYQRGGGR